MQKLIIYILSILFIMLGLSAFKWKKQESYREVVITNGDISTRANVLVNKIKIQPQDELMYYWYSSGNLGNNMGGYYGFLLYGPYHVIDNDEHLIEKGYFLFGLKNGQWKYWSESGELNRIEEWKEGKLHGWVKNYEDGVLVEEIHYKNGEIVSDRSWPKINFAWLQLNSKDDSLAVDSLQN